MGRACFRWGLCVLVFSLSIVDLGNLQSSCQNTKCQIAALKGAPSWGTSWCPRKEKHLVLGLITSAPRLHSFDLSQAFSAEPDWKLRRTALMFTALLITFNTERRRVQLYSSSVQPNDHVYRKCNLLIKLTGPVCHSIVAFIRCPQTPQRKYLVRGQIIFFSYSKSWLNLPWAKHKRYMHHICESCNNKCFEEEEFFMKAIWNISLRFNTIVSLL